VPRAVARYRGYPTEDEVSNGVRDFGSWHNIVNKKTHDATKGLGYGVG